MSCVMPWHGYCKYVFSHVNIYGILCVPVRPVLEYSRYMYYVCMPYMYCSIVASQWQAPILEYSVHVYVHVYTCTTRGCRTPYTRARTRACALHTCENVYPFVHYQFESMLCVRVILFNSTHEYHVILDLAVLGMVVRILSTRNGSYSHCSYSHWE